MSKYKSWTFEKVYSFTSQPSEKILPSIPNTILPEIAIKDDLVDTKLHLALHEYLLNQTWHHWWAPLPGETQIYKPSDWDDSWINAAVMSRSIRMPRCLFGSDADSVRKKHPLVWELWQQINLALGDQWDITGIPEEMAWDKYPVPVPTDPTLEQGWRCYANASMHDLIQLGGHIHRDTINLNDADTATILWVANKEWYPTWGGEIIFYPEDPDGLSGDHQQYGSGQKRNFRIGWPDDGKIVSFKPNRLICFDGRTLHSIYPTKNRSNVDPVRRIVFRARKKAVQKANEFFQNTP